MSMSADSAEVTATKPTARSRVTNGSALLPGVDGRSTWVRRCRDLIEAHTSEVLDLSGDSLRRSELARLLRPFGIKSKQVRIGTVNKHGYQLEQFTDAFERYLPGNTPSQNATTLQANGDGGLSDIQDATASRRVAFASPRKASSDASCSVVADENGGSREIARPRALYS